MAVANHSAITGADDEGGVRSGRPARNILVRSSPISAGVAARTRGTGCPCDADADTGARQRRETDDQAGGQCNKADNSMMTL